MRFLWLGNASHFSHILVEMKNLPKPPYSVSFLGWNANGFHRDIERKRWNMLVLEHRWLKSLLRVWSQGQLSKVKGKLRWQAGGAGRRGRLGLVMEQAGP